MPAAGQTLELTLVPGAQIVVHGRRPAALDQAWPFTAELADGRPFVGGATTRVVTRTPVDSATRIGWFPEGDHELVPPGR